MRTCEKVYYLHQAAARAALASVLARAVAEGKPARIPVRVYPCDVCDGWHLTSKRVTGTSTPPWDRDPDWVRPGGTAGLLQRSTANVFAGSRRKRKRARSGVAARNVDRELCSERPSNSASDEH
jgi:hypothetical protein